VYSARDFRAHAGGRRALRQGQRSTIDLVGSEAFLRRCPIEQRRRCVARAKQAHKFLLYRCGDFVSIAGTEPVQDQFVDVEIDNGDAPRSSHRPLSHG
jgi:hypothetical protein